MTKLLSLCALFVPGLGKPAAQPPLDRAKHLEEQLTVAKGLAEAANQAKDHFLANVSHEIRTPLNVILGMTELMLDDALTAPQQARLSIAKAAGDNLLVLIDDLLDFSKIEAGNVELALSELSLRAAIDESVERLAASALQKGLLLHAEVDPALPARVIGDAARVRQVLINLLANAVKFTLHGHVLLRADVVESHPERVFVRFTVSDTGIGIPADKQAAMFQAFTQQDTSTTRTHGGTGLGLTMAARLAMAMSGGITVESKLGYGSTFTFFAWFARARHDTNSDPLQILVAEDNKLNAELMLQLIARRGHRGSVVTRGDDVLARIEHGGVDLLLLDLHMPGMDGFQVIEQLRARERTSGKHLPVVAVTARALPAVRERCLESGMDDFISKPVRASTLWSIVDRLSSYRFAEVPTSNPPWLDASVLLGACDADPDVLAKICSSLRVQLPDELVRAAVSLQQADALRLRESAHKLYAMIGVVSTASACSDVADLEELAARGALGEAAVAFARVKELSASILFALDTLSIAGLKAAVASCT